jgi:hypothetical protein
MYLLSKTRSNLEPATTGTIPADIAKLEGFRTRAPDENTGNASSVDRTLWHEDVTLATKGTQLEYAYVSDVVVSLDLSGNALSGAIPDAIGSLTGLFSLNLSRNLLSGPIPASLGRIASLESLDLSGNRLDGPIPLELTGLTSLTFLNLSDNLLSGAVPTGNIKQPTLVASSVAF